MICGLQQGIITNSFKRDTTQNITLHAEEIFINCSLSLKSETENIVSMTAQRQQSGRHNYFSASVIRKISQGRGFKNAYELLNLRALKISMLYKSNIFSGWVRYFVWNFKGYL